MRSIEELRNVDFADMTDDEFHLYADNAAAGGIDPESVYDPAPQLPDSDIAELARLYFAPIFDHSKVAKHYGVPEYFVWELHRLVQAADSKCLEEEVIEALASDHDVDIDTAWMVDTQCQAPGADWITLEERFGLDHQTIRRIVNCPDPRYRDIVERVRGPYEVNEIMTAIDVKQELNKEQIHVPLVEIIDWHNEYVDSHEDEESRVMPKWGIDKWGLAFCASIAEGGLEVITQYANNSTKIRESVAQMNQEGN